MRLDVEVRDEKEANEAIDAGADVIMLDNLGMPTFKTMSGEYSRTIPRW